MADKIFRDPLYNYISIDRQRDGWLLKLLDTPEVQRLRRIHQLGVAHLTYPGADHNRLAHSLGVLHLMFQAFRHLETVCNDQQVQHARSSLLAAALLHDVGHGPFSHLFEPCLGIDHEEWSKRIVLSEDSGPYRVLRFIGKELPQTVADLIDKNNANQHAWMKYLLSSQLDMDRLDYLRRDSLFSGAGYGHYDHFRILNSFELYDEPDGNRSIVWQEKAKLAIEEYIFARHYMYQNVYLHKTTRGFEKMVEAMWRRARKLHDEGTDARLLPSIQDFWDAENPSVEQYVRIEEFTVMQQIQDWTQHPDVPLSDLARRFLDRDRFAMIEPPAAEDGLTPSYERWHSELTKLVNSNIQYADGDMYCLVDQVKGKYNQPYFPEKETDEQSVKNAIRLLINDKPVEISTQLGRLKPLTEQPPETVRYYIPRDLLPAAQKLRNDWKDVP